MNVVETQQASLVLQLELRTIIMRNNENVNILIVIKLKNYVICI